MGELQLFFSGWMTALAERLPLGYAFGAGMVSTVNPCGFTLLPVYLTLFLGLRDEAAESRPLPLRLLRAVGVAAGVTGGFVLLFGVVGLLISLGARFLIDVMPWLALIIGAGLVLLGLWLLAGRHLSADVFLRLSARLGDPRTAGPRGFFMYGVAYAICSLSCTLPVFLLVVGSAVTAGGMVAGLMQFVSYGLGMGLVILVLTVGMALFKEGVIVGRIRRAMPYLHYATGTLVLLAGIYIVVYWVTNPGGPFSPL